MLFPYPYPFFCIAIRPDSILKWIISTVINGGVCIDLPKSHYNDIINLFMNCFYCEVKKKGKQRISSCLLTEYWKNKTQATLPHNVMIDFKMLIFTFSMVTHTYFHCRVLPVEFFDSHPRQHLNIYCAFLVFSFFYILFGWLDHLLTTAQG